MSIGLVSIDLVESSDSELVAAVRAGDGDAFEELYRRYRPRISGYVYRIVRDHGRAEDVTQEAFLSALRRMRQTEAEIAFKPWLFEIARNAAIDSYRRTSRAEEVSIAGDDGLGTADLRRLVGASGPDAALIDKERLEHLQGALDELSETHHQVLVMRELEGLAYREIGERMKLSRPAVESTLFRARRKLEHEYEEIETGRRCNAVGIVISRLAEGIGAPRDRARLDRHARRCSSCRRRARELGIEPIVDRRFPAQVAALLPLPAVLRRREVESTPAGQVALGVQHGMGGLVPAVLPSLEAGAVWGKAAATMAAALVLGAGGATLGGEGPLAVDRNRVVPDGEASSAIVFQGTSGPRASGMGDRAATTGGERAVTSIPGAAPLGEARAVAPAAGALPAPGEEEIAPPELPELVAPGAPAAPQAEPAPEGPADEDASMPDPIRESKTVPGLQGVNPGAPTSPPPPDSQLPEMVDRMRTALPEAG